MYLKNMIRAVALSAFLCSSSFANTLNTVVGQPELGMMVENIRLLQPAERDRYGEHIGQEFIRQDVVGKNFMRIVQVERFERHLKVWNFYFYRGQNGWYWHPTAMACDILESKLPASG